MANTNDLLKNILSDMRVELAEMFDRNFERKGFFDSKWTPRKSTKALGSLLHVTGKMRRSIRPLIRGKGVQFTSSLPYTELHNTGGKFMQTIRTHNRTNKKTGKIHQIKSHSRTTSMPQRQFIGDHAQVKQTVKNIINENVTDYFHLLAKQIKR